VAYVDPAEGKQNYENDLRCDAVGQLMWPSTSPSVALFSIWSALPLFSGGRLLLRVGAVKS